ncbi:sialate O-acetylesterase [Haloferula sp. A504]|uniref:sialate O-acetylesterase n=1 Tax=Haloferula sp. A504 TaxID=3373601 RepID=UPI0031C05184|nr:sialate O-acetylesterase [Verrucomicrobiaceae bacterium E54]
MKPISFLAATLSLFALHAAPVPLELSRPDGKPGNSDKPVKVYILAGQSNMVGMGDIQGARPPHPAVYLSADPAIIPGQMPAGTQRSKGACKWFWKNIPALRSHGLFQSADESSPTGAVVAIHKGAYDPKADYTKLKPAESTTMKLGQVAATVPALEGACTTVARAFIEVPETGSYLVHVGFGDSTHAVAQVNGREVYRKETDGQPALTKVTLEAGQRYPLTITYLRGGSAALWLEQVDLVGKGDLVTLTKKDGKFPFLVDEAGEWTVRQDVHFREARVLKGDKSGPLTATSNGGSIGPELGFGFVMGTYHDEQVLLIKTAMGNRSLASDFRPPSSGKFDPESEWEGLEYRLMLKGVRETLENIGEYVPGYQGQGYELTGFCWFQGHKDRGSSKEEYESHLVNLIQDLRKDLEAPNMKAVVATAGFGGYRILSGDWSGVWEAQMAVGDPAQHPEFKGNVASVDTRDFWREIEESPRSQDYHYHRNPEFYLLTGEAMGRAMVRLQGGEAAEMPKSDREAKTKAAMATEAATPEPTAEQIAASNAAVKPMILDGLLQAYLADPRNRKKLETAFVTATPMPDATPEYLEDTVDDVVAFMQEAGIHEYDWTPVPDGMRTADWQIFGFDLADNPYDQTTPVKLEKGQKFKPTPVELKFPAGQENWFAPDFDPQKAGWRSAPAPFGMAMEEERPEGVQWLAKYALYPVKRPLPTTVVENDVLLMRGSFELPPVKDGHRYRIRVDGSINGNSGEGFAIYVDGRLLGEQKNGVTAWRRQGLRGSHVWQEFRDDFGGGKVTIAVANFPMSNWNPDSFIPAIGPLSVWIEEQKLPQPELPPLEE